MEPLYKLYKGFHWVYMGYKELYWDNGKENADYYIRGYIGVYNGLYWGKMGKQKRKRKRL